MSVKPYTTKASVEAFLGKALDSVYTAKIDAWILAMSRYMDNYCNRTLYDDQKDTFKYDGDGSDMILIKDCVDVEMVAIDGIETTSYVKYPSNKPYASRIKLTDGYTFPIGSQNVEVEGIQAMSKELKPDIQMACDILVAGIVNASILNIKGKSEKIGNYTVTYSESAEADAKTALSILDGYCRIAL